MASVEAAIHTEFCTLQGSGKRRFLKEKQCRGWERRRKNDQLRKQLANDTVFLVECARGSYTPQDKERSPWILRTI